MSLLTPKDKKNLTGEQCMNVLKLLKNPIVESVTGDRWKSQLKNAVVGYYTNERKRRLDSWMLSDFELTKCNKAIKHISKLASDLAIELEVLNMTSNGRLSLIDNAFNLNFPNEFNIFDKTLIHKFQLLSEITGDIIFSNPDIKDKTLDSLLILLAIIYTKGTGCDINILPGKTSNEAYKAAKDGQIYEHSFINFVQTVLKDINAEYSDDLHRVGALAKRIERAVEEKNYRERVWYDFEIWCRSNDVSLLPTNPGIVSSYLNERPEGQDGLSQAYRRKAIKYFHTKKGYELDI
jgi:hypothetical protein